MQLLVIPKNVKVYGSLTLADKFGATEETVRRSDVQKLTNITEGIIIPSKAVHCIGSIAEY